MGYRTILSSNVTLLVRNTSSTRVVVSGANLAPGKQRQIAGEVFSEDKFRARELYNLVSAGKVQVMLHGNGWDSYVLTAAEVGALASNVAPKPIRVVAAASRPGVATVPAGTVLYNTDAAALQVNNGAAWVP